MKQIEFISCVLRIIGVWLLINFFDNLASASAIFQQVVAETEVQDKTITALFIFTPVVIAVLIALLLIFLPVQLAKLILPKSVSQGDVVELKRSTLTISGLSILGFYIVSTGLADLVSNALHLMNYNKHGMSESFEYGEVLAYQIATVVELCIGALLIFSSKKIH